MHERNQLAETSSTQLKEIASLSCIITQLKEAVDSLELSKNDLVSAKNCIEAEFEDSRLRNTKNLVELTKERDALAELSDNRLEEIKSVSGRITSLEGVVNSLEIEKQDLVAFKCALETELQDTRKVYVISELVLDLACE